MNVDHAKSSRLEAQMRQDKRQDRVFMHIGEIADMIGVTIIQRINPRASAA